MKRYKDIHQDALDYERNNPDATIAEAYQRGYVNGVRDKKNNTEREPSPPHEEQIFILDDSPMPTFEDFWQLYGKKRSKKQCEKKWNRLPIATQMVIMERLPAYVSSTPDIQFRCDPLTYLNGERWEDEIITPSHNNNNGRDETTFLTDKAQLIARLNERRNRGGS